MISLVRPVSHNPRDSQYPEPIHRATDERSQLRIGSTRTSQMEFDPDTIVESIIAEIRVNIADDVPTRRTFVSKEHHLGVSAQELSDRWCIGLKQNTIKVTTQLATRSVTMPLSRRYRADRVFENPLLRGQFYTNTLDGCCKSLDRNSYTQVFFANKDLFAVVYPMASKSMAGESLRQFVHDCGRPEHLTYDGSGEQCGKKTEFMLNIRKYSIDYHITECDRPNHDFAEGVIQEVRKKWFRIMVRRKVPQRLWDYGLRTVVYCLAPQCSWSRTWSCRPKKLRRGPMSSTLPYESV